MKFKILIIIFLCALSPNLSQAQEPYTIFLNEIPYSTNTKVMPCYPVMASFHHPNPNVTRIKMRYPYNHGLYMIFPVHETTHITLHENFMKQNQTSISDFIAEDDAGNSYGQITLTFLPMGPENNPDRCNNFVNS